MYPRRIHKDQWICIMLGCLVSILTVAIAKRILIRTYPNYVINYTAAAGYVGGIANESVHQAQSVEDLLTYDIFTILLERIEDSGYYRLESNLVIPMYAVALPSGELVAVLFDPDSVWQSENNSSEGSNILLAGRVVFEDLEKDNTFLRQIEFNQPLSRRDFYVDMRGISDIGSLEDYMKYPIYIVRYLTIFISSIIFHIIGDKFGIFPYPLFPKLTEKKFWHTR